MNTQIKQQIEQEALRIYPKDKGINSRGVVFDLDQAPRRAWIEGAEYGYSIKESVNDEWIDVSKSQPKEYGRYLVYRGGKVHFETWNNTGWAYNHNSITHWKQINPPKDK